MARLRSDVPRPSEDRVNAGSRHVVDHSVWIGRKTTARVGAAIAATFAVLAVAPSVAGSAGAQTQPAPDPRPAVTSPVESPVATPTSTPGGGAEVDVLEASRDEVLARVEGLDARIRAAEQAASAAQTKVDSANAAAMVAGAKAQEAQQRADEAADDVRSYAVEAFVRPPSQDALSTLAISETRDAAYATDVLKIVAQQRRQVVDTMTAARTVADSEGAAADEALRAAHAEVDAARIHLEELRSVRSQQSRLASQLDDRLDAKLAEAAALKNVDAGVADLITAQEVSLRTSGPASSGAAPTPGGGGRPPTMSSSVSGSPAPVPTVPTATTAPRPTPTTAPPVTAPPTGPPATVPGLVTWSDVTKAGGIWVHTSIAGQVSALVAAARSAGISLSGGGFRDPASQIALRTAHCGTSTYAIYQMPASQCTPPTARPGTSMHERGLAMDLQSSGRLITSRSDPAFVWLAANAARFGFRNLPSEPWHWSTNGS